MYIAKELPGITPEMCTAITNFINLLIKQKTEHHDNHKIPYVTDRPLFLIKRTKVQAIELLAIILEYKLDGSTEFYCYIGPAGRIYKRGYLKDMHLDRGNILNENPIATCGVWGLKNFT